MTPVNFALYFTCLLVETMAQTINPKSSIYVRQKSGFIPANVGDNVTLECFYGGDAAMFYWYKQTLGQKPRLMSSFYKHEKSGKFRDEFKDNPRFTLDTGNGKNHLTISDLHILDSATYYCIGSYSYKFEFAEGATVSVKGSGLNIQSWVHQSASESIQPGGSVTLSCTVHTGTCDGEHSVYWFRDSEESHPGLIYTHGDRNDQCERKPNTQTHTCVYNLPMENLNPSHAGTYSCAVASCGHILFGNGTKLDFEDKGDSLVSVLSGALAFSTILNVFLVFSVCVTDNRSSCLHAESSARFSDRSKNNAEDHHNEGHLYYKASGENKMSRRSRQKGDTWSECVYFSVKQQS